MSITPATPTVGSDRDLATLADAINAEHVAVCDAIAAGLAHARRAGEMLAQAKAQVPHGEWLPWLERNVRFSARTAQGYIRVASRWCEIEPNTQRVAHLSYREALALLAEPEPPDTRLIPRDGHALGAWDGHGRTVSINPSTSRGFYFVTLFDLDSGIVDGSERPVRTDYIEASLALLNPADRVWYRRLDWREIPFASHSRNPWLNPELLAPADPPAGSAEAP
jgi:hypothetical protein